jgi:hypothetical protein
MKKLLTTLLSLSLLVYATSCGDDEAVVYVDPTVTAATVADQQIGATGTATFTVSVDKDLTATFVATSTGGITLASATGTVSGTSVPVSFTANTAGAASITLTITDSEGTKANATAVFSVLAPNDNPVLISGIPATASIKAGTVLTVPNVKFDALDGLDKLEVLVNGTAVAALGQTLTGTTATVTFTAAQTASLPVGNHIIIFRVTDKNGTVATFTHVLTITAFPRLVIDANVSGTRTWSKDTIYELAGRVTVLSGATLNISAGTIVKGQPGTGANATALLISRGGKLNASGTEAAPIIFTSTQDEIQPGQIVSPNMTPEINGLWGGLIILGNARISASNANGDRSEVQIEGIPTSDANGLYGGTNDADNSGTIRYISVRHGGSNIGAGNEINGITLGGVGSGTIIENVEVVANQDDGIEFFGGTVNVKNAVVWNNNDDGIDTDQSWAGTLDNFVVIGQNTAGAHCFELDGPEGSYAAGHIIKNGSVKASFGDRKATNLIDTDENSIVTLENIYITGIVAGQIINRVTAPRVVYTKIELDVPAANLATFVNGVVPAGITAVTPATKTVGANISVFGWTWTSRAGAMSGL